MFQHCLLVYNKMLEQSMQGADSMPSVYRGYLTHLIRDDLGLPLPYYTTIKRALEDLGCIDQVKRGGGPQPSEWLLYHPPDPLAYAQLQFNNETRGSRIEMLEQAVASMNQRLGKLERMLAARQRVEQAEARDSGR